jgi:protein involved in polysaccharide export with SLBB domain
LELWIRRRRPRLSFHKTQTDENVQRVIEPHIPKDGLCLPSDRIDLMSLFAPAQYLFRSGQVFGGRRLRLFFRSVTAGILTFLFLGSGSLAQTILDPQSQQQPQTNCSDPEYASSPACQSVQPTQNQGVPQTSATQRSTIDSERQNIGRDIYLDSAGFPIKGYPYAGNTPRDQIPPDPITDFQRLVKDSTGEFLPIFGRDLFRKPPSTFAPADQIAVSPDYVIGPGDEVVVRVWGHNNFDGRLTVDRSGAIYVPQVGAIHVAGLHYSELRDQIQHDLTRSFRNFELSVNLGQLRSIQIYVLGEAVHPGSYTVSSLSTAFNALLVSGGPTVNGSLRTVQVQRNKQTVATIDLYDFILRGDKSKDAILQAGDVIFIPVAGPQVAVSGSVRRPAIYEVQPTTTVGELLNLAGGLSSTASGSHVSMERITDRHDRQALSFNLDTAGLATSVIDGDVLHIDSMLASYKDSVTIRGNLANAGRFAWHTGMKLSDIIPDRESLLTNDYWKRRNQLGVPTPLFEPLNDRYSPNNHRPLSNTNDRSGDNRPYGSTSSTPLSPNSPNQQYPQDNGYGNTNNAGVDDRNLSQQDRTAIARQSETAANQLDRRRTSRDEVDRGSLADQQFEARQNTERGQRRNEVRVPYPEIDWSYAVIERLDPKTLRSSLISFNLGKLVMDHDSTQDLPLQPGDIVTILSQSDIQVSQDERTKYVRLEGEFASSGVYSVGPDETLADVVRRAGGFTGKAYLFGATFTRESARVMQQQRLDEYISELSIQIERTSAERNISSTNPIANTGSLDNEKAMIQQLHAMRATGRVVLEFKPDSTGMTPVPALPLENGDVFRVPSRPMMVSVVGAVYGQNVFLYNPSRHTRDYLNLAGKPNRVADKKHAFIIRADGSIFSKETTGGLWSDHFDTASIFPGDTIVVPERPIRPSVLRDVIDWSQVFSQFAIGAAAIQVIK